MLTPLFFLFHYSFSEFVNQWQGDCSQGAAGAWSVISEPSGTWSGACSQGSAGSWDIIDIDE